MIALTQYQKDIKYFFNTIYRPMLARVTGGAASLGYRFPTRKEGDAEAWECAKLHTGLLKGRMKITDVGPDPWADWRGKKDSPNPGVRKQASVNTYVVDENGNVLFFIDKKGRRVNPLNLI
jgi:hypothetical protein